MRLYQRQYLICPSGGMRRKKEKFDLVNMPQYTNPFYYDVTPAKDEHVYISIQQMEESFLFETLPDAEKFISECESNSENNVD